MGACPDDNTLDRFACDQLTEEEAAVVESHVESCRRCAKRLANLPLDVELLQQIRDLERSRTEIEPSLSALTELEEKLTTTLFGPSNKT